MLVEVQRIVSGPPVIIVIFVLGLVTVIDLCPIVKFTFDTSVTLVCSVPVMRIRAAVVIGPATVQVWVPSLGVEATMVSHDPAG